MKGLLIKYSVFLFLIICQFSGYSQTTEDNKKDSIMNFLVRGLWIQYEREKELNPNNDTLIQYTREEEKKYYSAEISSFNSDTFYLMNGNYVQKTLEFFEKKTGIKRKTIHRATQMIPFLDKDIIIQWQKWYSMKRNQINLDELNLIIMH
jgi:hypothetical protein